MDSTSFAPTTANSPSPPPATALIELTAITPKNGKLIVAFGGGGHNWMLSCKASDLQSFPRFQAKVCDQIGLWIDHHSQSAQRAARRKEYWDDAVRTTACSPSTERMICCSKCRAVRDDHLSLAPRPTTFVSRMFPKN